MTLIDDLNQLGESEVIRRLINGGLGEPGSVNYASAQEWLRVKKLEREDALRLRRTFLNKIYEIAKGATDPINGGEVASQIGLKNEETDQVRKIVKYLEGEGFIKVKLWARDFPAFICLTHEGIREIEGANNQPKNTQPINVLSVGQVIGSTIQQGTIGSNQTLNISFEGIEQLWAFVKQLSQSVNELQLKTDERGELNAEVATVEAQLASPKPKAPILREGLSSIKRILEAAAGSAIGAHLAKQIPILLTLLEKNLQ